jgi:hypothetical protein
MPQRRLFYDLKQIDKENKIIFSEENIGQLRTL